MNRVRLSAFAAVLLLADPVVLFAQEKTMTTSTGMELVWIPPGEFMLGSTSEEREWAVADGLPEKNAKVEGEEPRRVRIATGFWMGRAEMTIGQWKQFAEASGYITDTEKAGEASVRDRENHRWSMVRGACWRNPKFGFKLKDNHPICYMSWNDAVAFCEWLTEKEKKANKLPVGMVGRLPTEAEWEYACRAGTTTKFWWGDQKGQGDGRLNRGDKSDGFDFVSPVDNYKARGRNRWGLADMLGNVWEWCLDDVDPTQAHGECFKGNSNARVLRGGSFSDARTTRCAYRRGLPPSRGDCDFGFRVCFAVPGGSGQSLGVIASVAQKRTEERKPAVAGVADSEMQKDARKFARNQSSIKGLYVVRTEAGLRVGGAQDIIATAERVSSNLDTICDFVSKVGDDTQISMEEAERLLKVRYPVWQAGHKIRFSYSN
ncbi:MAG: formylglycine-generating enzyme family protein, partial [Verrucomicrobiia bacterium]